MPSRADTIGPACRARTGTVLEKRGGVRERCAAACRRAPQTKVRSHRSSAWSRLSNEGFRQRCLCQGGSAELEPVRPCPGDHSH